MAALMLDQLIHPESCLCEDHGPPVLPAHMQKGQSDEVRTLKRKIRRVMIEAERVLLVAVNKWMRWQTEVIMDDYEAAGETQTIAKQDEVDIFVANFTDWEALVAGGIAITKPAISNAFGEGGKIAFSLVEFMPFPFDPLKVSSAALVDEICSTMVTAVTDETRMAINTVIRNGLEQGKGFKAIGRELRPKVGLSNQMIGWSANREEQLLIDGFSRAQVDRKIAAYDRKLHRMRNETIARTEAARAMNEGQLQGFAEAGVEKVYWFALADRCPICDPHDGEEFTLNASRGVLPFHPRCYDKLTEVYTEHGWQLIKDIEKETVALTLNPETKDLEWDYVVATTSHHESHLYHITNKQHSFDMMVTEDHPFFIYKRVHRGKKGRHLEPMTISGVHNLNSESAFYLSSQWQGDNPLIIPINGLNFRADEYCVLMGYYLSEGSVVQRETGRYQISIHQERHLFQMWDDLKNIPVRKLWLGKNKIYIPDNLLGEYLMQFGKSHERFVPDEIKSLAPQYIRIFLDAYNLGDGHVRPGKDWKNAGFADSFSYATTSKRMADDLGELIIKSGKAVSYHFEERAGRMQKFANGTYKINHDLWVINELTSKYRMFTNMSAEKVEYDDYVYDIEVAHNHTILTRRNGRVVWGSNCRCMWLPLKVAA